MSRLRVFLNKEFMEKIERVVLLPDGLELEFVWTKEKIVPQVEQEGPIRTKRHGDGAFVEIVEP
jgi:hypothetical protein